MKNKVITVFLIAILTIATFSGCSDQRADGIPYPDEFIVPKAEKIESSAQDEEKVLQKEKNERSEDATEKSGEIRNKVDAADNTTPHVANNFFDVSGSMRRSAEVVNIHSAASKSEAGFERHYYTLDSKQNLMETDERLSLSGQYGVGAVIDLIGTVDIPTDSNGVNILTTDLQTGTSCTEIGEWLVNTGSTGYTFYVFTMTYDGSLQFRAYTSNSVKEDVSISDCYFSEKEFLMVVFGQNNLVEAFDTRFQSKIGDSLNYDKCHVSLNVKEEQPKSFLELHSSKCFTDNLANITYDGTNYCYGLAEAVTRDTEFTLDNTFVYMKSKKSANADTDAVKAVLYGTSDEGIPEIIKDETKIKVLEFDPESNMYRDSSVGFDVDIESCPNGMKAAEDEELNAELGGNLVAKGPVLAVTAENKALPKGLYAVEVQLVCAATGEAASLQKFAVSHSAGLEEYISALKTECISKKVNGKASTSRYNYVGNPDDSVFTSLLEFERLADELIAAGVESGADNNAITFRLIIDNR